MKVVCKSVPDGFALVSEKIYEVLDIVNVNYRIVDENQEERVFSWELFRVIEEGFECPCCHQRTLSDRGHWDVCSNCKWKDDPIQRDDPDRGGGSNQMSLKDAWVAYMESRPIR